jgi:hypothetical protein
MNEPVTMIVKYSAHVFMSSNPRPSVRKTPRVEKGAGAHFFKLAVVHRPQFRYYLLKIPIARVHMHHAYPPAQDFHDVVMYQLEHPNPHHHEQ